MKRDGLATVTGFDGHPVQFTLTCQMVQEALHTGGALLLEGSLAQFEKKMVTSQERLTFTNLKNKEVTLVL